MDIPIHEAMDALSRLAAPKPEGQALTVEQVGWLRVVLGRALYRVEHFPEQSNDEGIEADELARAIILLGGEPSAPEPRPAEEAMPEAIAAADMINDAIDRARVSGDGAGLYTRILSIVDEALRSQLTRKDEGLKKALAYLPEHLRHLRAKNDPKALSLTNDLEDIRAALRESDGRKGE